MKDIAYRHVETRLARGGCVVLDGGVATELQRLGFGPPAGPPVQSAGWALYQAREQVLDIHRGYVRAGCDVVSTNTWSILENADSSRGRRAGRGGLPAWTDAARDAIHLARAAIAQEGRKGRCAVGFSLNGTTLAHPPLAGEMELLLLLWETEPPDIVLIETLASLPDPALLKAIGNVAAIGLPVWVSFRRGGVGMCSVDGHEIPDPEPGRFADAVGALEQAGAGAVLVNCVPVERVCGALEALAGVTSLPIGCYPRLGRPGPDGWVFADPDPPAYAELALRWRSAGARIIGGCCGVTPVHIREASDRLSPRGHPVGSSLS
jgi:S-methylmethionine-dependent homocysteine/selenocysteine methylase